MLLPVVQGQVLRVGSPSLLHSQVAGTSLSPCLAPRID